MTAPRTDQPLKPLPSLSGHPDILSEVCFYSAPPALCRMLRLDRQMFSIAGKHLYRHHALHLRGYTGRNFVSPFHTYLAVVKDKSQKRVEDLPPGPHSLIYSLINFIEVLDLTEYDAVTLSRMYLQDGIAIPCLDRLQTLIIRSDPESYHSVDQPITTFLPGWQPKRVVVVGDLAALYRLTTYYREKGQPDEPLTMLPGGKDKLWPSVHQILHIIPYIKPYPYPEHFQLRTADGDITATFPSLTSYQCYLDIDYINRKMENGYPYEPSRAECHLIRALAWTIRNSRAELPITIWLGPAAQEIFHRRVSLVSTVARCPLRDRTYSNPQTMIREFPVWDQERIDERLEMVKVRICGEERERQWRIATDEIGRRVGQPRLAEYVDSILRDGNVVGHETVDGNPLMRGGGGEEIVVDWNGSDDYDHESEDEYGGLEGSDEFDVDSEEESEDDDHYSYDDYGYDDYVEDEYYHEGDIEGPGGIQFFS